MDSQQQALQQQGADDNSSAAPNTRQMMGSALVAFRRRLMGPHIKKLSSPAMSLIAIMLSTLCIYTLCASISEHFAYTKNSIAYFLLTPDGLSEMSAFCQTRPSFVSSAADGPKPARVTLHCTLSYSDITNYLHRNTFTRNPNGTYSKGNERILVTGDKAGNAKAVSLLHYLQYGEDQNASDRKLPMIRSSESPGNSTKHA